MYAYRARASIAMSQGVNSSGESAKSCLGGRATPNLSLGGGRHPGKSADQVAVMQRGCSPNLAPGGGEVARVNPADGQVSQEELCSSNPTLVALWTGVESWLGAPHARTSTPFRIEESRYA